MGKLNNTRRIKAEDYEDDYSQLVSQLGSILNSHMQEVEDILDSSIDFDNKVENVLEFNITVGADGRPIQTPFKVNTGLNHINGFTVISARNQTNSIVYPTGQPFISFTPVGGGIVKIDHISGLVGNNKYLLKIIAY
jgi:hypothetical protein